MNFTTAIVMSTYNGEEYIIEQLDSIRNQTLRPDFVIISDDKSTDNTASIIEEYIHKYNLDNWTFQINKKNVGWKKNFFNLLDTCDADLIFLSDQDDIWHINKLAIMVPYFENDNVGLLVSGFSNRKDNLFFSKYNKKKSKVKKINFTKKYLYGVPYPGCSYCVRKTFFESIREYHEDCLPHDAFVYRNALLLEKLYKVDQTLLIHRLHNNNAGSSTISSRKNDIEYYKKVNDLLLKMLKTRQEVSKEYEKIIRESYKWLELRCNFFKTKNLVQYVKLLKYIGYYPHCKTYIKDFLIAFCG